MRLGIGQGESRRGTGMMLPQWHCHPREKGERTSGEGCHEVRLKIRWSIWYWLSRSLKAAIERETSLSIVGKGAGGVRQWICVISPLPPSHFPIYATWPPPCNFFVEREREKETNLSLSWGFLSARESLKARVFFGQFYKIPFLWKHQTKCLFLLNN